MRVCREPRNAACLRAFHREKQTGGDSLPPVFCCASKGAKGGRFPDSRHEEQGWPGKPLDAACCHMSGDIRSMDVTSISAANRDMWPQPRNPLLGP